MTLTQMTLLVVLAALLWGRSRAGVKSEGLELAYIAHHGSEEQVRDSQKWTRDATLHKRARNRFLLGMSALWGVGLCWV